MSKQVIVDQLPRCDFCKADATYDARTILGPWAYMCKKCWVRNGSGRLGTGYGQKLILVCSLEKGDRQ